MPALSMSIGGTTATALPAAEWSPNTGGSGWSGTLAVSPISYTGSWSAQRNGSGASTALGSTTAGTYTGTQDGVYYLVTVTGTPTGTSTPFTWTSDATGGTSGSAIATNGAAHSVGGNGLSITFSTGTTYRTGDSYSVLAGTQSATSVIVDTAAAGAVTASTLNIGGQPSYVDNGSVVNGGTTVGTVNAAGAVKVLSASSALIVLNSYWTASPGVSFTADSNSWAAAYSGQFTYTIANSP